MVGLEAMVMVVLTYAWALVQRVLGIDRSIDDFKLRDAEDMSCIVEYPLCSSECRRGS